MMGIHSHLFDINAMKTDSNTTIKDETLEAAKRDQQRRSRELVRTGDRLQESMFLINPSIVKTLIIRHRSVEF